MVDVLADGCLLVCTEAFPGIERAALPVSLVSVLFGLFHHHSNDPKIPVKVVCESALIL